MKTFSRFKFSISIRFKIAALILAALATSLLCYLYVGTSLIVTDKASYIYDYNLSQVRTASELIQAQIAQLRAVVTVMGNLADTRITDDNAGIIRTFYEHQKNLFPEEGLLILTPVDANHFQTRIDFSGSPGAMDQILSRLGWTPSIYEKQEILTGSEVNGKIPLGFRMQDAQGKPVAALTLLNIGTGLLGDHASKFRLQLIDSMGNPLASTKGFLDQLEPTAVKRFDMELAGKKFPSGAEDWNDGRDDYIVAYQRIPDTGIMAVSMVSKSESFKAAEVLVQRSVLLGVSILLIAIAFTLIFAKGLTNRLRQLWRATQKVSEGDFTVRVDPGQGRDEMSGLANSFNSMADRISELMKETADKARMEKELETAQSVQNQFFPSAAFKHKNIQLAGKAIPATECAGDWWHYAQVGNFIIVAVGDVTGHGVSAALVTAAAHGAFSVLMTELQEKFSAQGEPPSLDFLLKHLNTAVLAASRGASTMTMILSVVDLHSGTMTTVNASHRPAYIYRPGPAAASDPIKAFISLMDTCVPALGHEKNISSEVSAFQLQPGDSIFWYTDGLVECENPAGKRIPKTRLLRMLAKISDQPGAEVEQICANVVGELAQFLESRAKNPDDDITVVVGRIPKNAAFLRQTPAA